MVITAGAGLTSVDLAEAEVVREAAVAASADSAAAAAVSAAAAPGRVGRRMRTKEFIENLEHDRIVRAIAAAEERTSGEIRVFIQHGAVDDPVGAPARNFKSSA